MPRPRSPGTPWRSPSGAIDRVTLFTREGGQSERLSAESALTIAVPTGRLFTEAVACFQRAGLLYEPAQERSLVVPAIGGGWLLIAKPVDIPVYVEHGAADAGIVGRDILLEQGRDVYELVDLGFGACRGVVALPEGEAEQLWQPGRRLRVATKYPRLTARYFEREGRPVDIIALNGALELAPRVGLADAIVDLVMTGKTLRDNFLVEVAQIFRSSARLVVNRASLRMKGAAVQRLIAAMETAKSN